MKTGYHYILLLLFVLLPFSGASQITPDSVSVQLKNLSEKNADQIDSVSNKMAAITDLVNQGIALTKTRLQTQIDSLYAIGEPVTQWQQKLDSLEVVTELSQQKYERLLVFERQWRREMKDKLSGLKATSSVTAKIDEKIQDVNDVSAELGIGPLGKDLARGSDASLAGIEIPGVNFNNALTQDLKIPTDGLGDEVITIDNAKNIKSNIKDAGDRSGEVSEYSSELKTITQDSLNHLQKLPALAEQQALQVEEMRELQKQYNLTEEQAKMYQELIEQYKEEKKILQEMNEKSKELANDVILKNQDKVDESMKKISKYKRKFPDVHDVRDLPKRAPNPLKNMSWRDRVIPGLTFQTFNSSRQWLQIDPQIYYKLNGSLSAGIGGMFRFSMNPGKITFDDFGNMYGGKMFSQWYAYKGFFLRAEAQYAIWKPEPDYQDKTWVAAIGIGKSYTFAKKIKGNVQTLYHWNWEGFDPYKPRIMIRLGFDFSFEKNEKKPWEKKLKEMNK